MMRFYLGTHQVDWLDKAQVPLFVSQRRLHTRKSLPRAAGPWALDSGGFSELSLFGCWVTKPKAYVCDVRRYIDEIGQMDWAAIQDWMCEPVMLAKTGLTVREHQRRTVASLQMLRDLAPELPWVPVIQGWVLDDYFHHVNMYHAAGVDLWDESLAGVGSVCRRQATPEAAEIFSELHGLGLTLHGFGVKLGGIRATHSSLASADSMAWSLSARQRRATERCSPQRTHVHCGNCLTYAKAWYEQICARLPKESAS